MKKKLPIIFFWIEALIYSTYVSLDLFAGQYSAISYYGKFAGVFLCFLFLCFSWFYLGRDNVNVLMITALFFTVLSDVFLYFSNVYIPGILGFCIVQSIYRYRLRKWRGFVSYITGSLIFTVLILTMLTGLKIEYNLLTGISIYYAICSIRNIITSFSDCQKSTLCTTDAYFAVAILLLFLCDINVGLSNLAYQTTALKIPPSFTDFTRVAVWIFYLPSQVFAALSGIRDVTLYHNHLKSYVSHDPSQIQ